MNGWMSIYSEVVLFCTPFCVLCAALTPSAPPVSDTVTPCGHRSSRAAAKPPLAFACLP